MAHTPQGSDAGDLRSNDDIDEVLSRANPNPDRIGCPPRDVLVRLARREQPIGDPAYEHLVKCSPCYREFRALQDERALPVVASGGSRRMRLLAAAAAVVLLLAGGWWLTRGERASPTPRQASTSSPAISAELDLRKFAVLRSETTGDEAPPVVLPANIVDVTVLLPVGSEPGPYEVQLLDADLRSRSESTGKGDIENFVTTLRVRMDLQRLAAGRYQLAVRRQGDSWRMFPALVR